MTYLAPKERMKISLRRSEVEATGKPFYTRWQDVPEGYKTKTKCEELKQPVREGEEPVSYVLARLWNGYLPLYDRT